MSPGGSNQVLANLLVQFKTENADALKAVLAAVQQQTTQLTVSVGILGNMMTAGFKASTDQAQKTTAAVRQLQLVTLQGTKDMVSAIGALTTAVGQFHFDYLNKAAGQAEATKKVGAEAGKLKAAFEKIGPTVNFALGTAQASILGFVRSGISASSMGQLLQIQMERLSLTIAGLFRPEIERVMQLVNRFTSYLQNLSSAQKENIAGLAKGAAAALALGIALPRVFAGVQTLIVGFRALGVAITGSLAATGIGALVPVITLAAQAMVVMLMSTKEGRSALAEVGSAAKDLARMMAELAVALKLDAFLVESAHQIAVWTSAAAKATKQTEQWIKALDKLGEKKTGTSNIASAILGGISFGGFSRIIEERLGIKQQQEKGKNRNPLIPRAGNFESLTATYERIARASVGAMSPEQEAKNQRDEMIRLMEEGNNINRNPRPQNAR